MDAENISAKNAERFKGYADVYDAGRPVLPSLAADILAQYLGRTPELVIDLGCGTGLSTRVWRGRCGRAVGIDPSPDMLALARRIEGPHMRFISGYAHATGMDDACADIVTCSQSFHWMEPASALNEIARVLRPGGIFAAIDYDWVPVTYWAVDKAYTELYYKVFEIERTHRLIKDTFARYPKANHLANIEKSGRFRYAREIAFSNAERFTAKRLIDFTLGQASLRDVMHVAPELIRPDVDRFIALVNETCGDNGFDAIIPYKMRLGVK